LRRNRCPRVNASFFSQPRSVTNGIERPFLTHHWDYPIAFKSLSKRPHFISCETRIFKYHSILNIRIIVIYLNINRYKFEFIFIESFLWTWQIFLIQFSSVFSSIQFYSSVQFYSVRD
jgi:hypothetical protein